MNTSLHEKVSRILGKEPFTRDLPEWDRHLLIKSVLDGLSKSLLHAKFDSIPYEYYDKMSTFHLENKPTAEEYYLNVVNKIGILADNALMFELLANPTMFYNGMHRITQLPNTGMQLSSKNLHDVLVNYVSEVKCGVVDVFVDTFGWRDLCDVDEYTSGFVSADHNDELRQSGYLGEMKLGEIKIRLFSDVFLPRKYMQTRCMIGPSGSWGTMMRENSHVGGASNLQDSVLLKLKLNLSADLLVLE